MKHTYAFSDAHGCWEPFQQLLNFIGPEDTVYCLGDCGDRGDEGWRIIDYVLQDPRFIYLKGNHEDMLVKAMDAYFYFYATEPNRDMANVAFTMNRDYNLLRMNGGDKTFEDWKGSDAAGLKHTLLKNLPLEKIYLNKQGQKVILTHSGYTLHLNTPIEEHDYIWNRYHFNQKWDDNFPDVVMVHGHTPVIYMDEFLKDCPKEIDGALWYCDNHKVDIDMCTVVTGKICLLDLDTWEQHIFKDNKIS
jgi:calcineurin-like phosphoesterase family protein